MADPDRTPAEPPSDALLAQGVARERRRLDEALAALLEEDRRTSAVKLTERD